ncbi:MAG TPA: LuxR family transcriptional regulator [Maritimibacter sp.]|nr:LuxR family transcriptional regulator [Maritimibacter sp.]
MGRNQIIDDVLGEISARAPAGYFIGVHIRFAGPLMTFRSYNKAWTDHYSRNGYALHDPMIAWGVSRTGAARWSEIDTPDPFGIMSEAAQFGLVYGLCISCGPTTSRTVTGMSRSDREYTDEEIATLNGLVVRLHTETEPPHNLTIAEQEALRIVRSGDRSAAGARTLGISESALKARLSTARNKLFARTTAEAIQRAKDYRLI